MIGIFSMRVVAEKNFRGFSAVEVLLATALFSIIAAAISGSLIYGQQSTANAGSLSQAAFLADEGIEVVRNIRNDSFANLTDGTYGLVISGNQWIFSGSSDTVGQFTRQVVISTMDSTRKTIASTVTWQQTPSRTGTITITTRLTAWQE